MKTVFGSGRHHYMKRAGIFLVMVALIAGMMGCPADDPTPPAQVEIENWHQLHAIRDNLAGHYRLMNNLDEDSDGYEEWVENQDDGWQPIGSKDNQFVGIFDGQGYEIRDLIIDRPDEDGVGLFGYVYEGGIVKNIAVKDATVTGKRRVGALVGSNWQGSVLSDPELAYSTNSTGSVTGEDSVGGLVGYSYMGTVSIAQSSAEVYSQSWRAGGLVGDNWGTVTQSRYYGEVTGRDQVGGLVGLNKGQVLICEGTNTVTVKGDTFVGGVAGTNLRLGGLNGSKFAGQVISPRNADSLVLLNEATVSNLHPAASVAVGSYVGGVVGFNEGTVDDCSSSGSVTGISYVGGLAGANEGTVDDCSSSSIVIGTSYVGGLVGGNEGTVDSCSSSGSVTGESAVGKLVGYNSLAGIVSNSTSTSIVTGIPGGGELVGVDEGSGSAAPVEPEYRLTIYSTTGGSATGYGYTSSEEWTWEVLHAGDVVTLTAEAEEGYRFVNWTAPAGLFGDAYAATTTFTMPAEDVTVTANFEPVSTPPLK